METTPMFVDLPTALHRLSREDGTEKTLNKEFDIRLALGVLSENYAKDWGEIIHALQAGVALATVSYVYSIKK